MEDELVDLSSFSEVSIEKEPGFFEKIKAKFSKKYLILASALLLIILSASTIFVANSVRKKTPMSRASQDNSQTSALFLNPSPTPNPSLTPNTLKETIGFLPSWIVAQKAKVYPERLTQIIYFGLGVTEDGELIQFTAEGRETNEWKYFNSEYFSQIRDEAVDNNTKVLIAIKSFDNETIDKLTSNPFATDKLINSLLTLVERYKLDGVNVDFEYVTDVDFPTAKYFNRFLETLSLRLKQKNPNLILSVDVNATAVLVDKAYDMVKIGEIADQVILMAYDYHRAASTRAGPVAPIDSPPNEHNINESLNSLYGRVPTEKIILGIPFYGYEWQTLNKSHKSPTVENTGALATYKRVRDLIDNRDDEIVVWDDIAKSPWLTYAQSGAIKQIYYENERSLEEKLKFAEGRGLSGIAIWALGYEGDHQEPWEVIEKYFTPNPP